MAVEVSGPRAPRQLIGTLQVPEVVDLEARRPTLDIGLKEDVAGHFAELQRLVVAPKGGTCRVEGDSRVRTLVVVRGVALRRGDRLRAARDSAEIERTGDLVAPAGETMTEVERTDVGARM